MNRSIEILSCDDELETIFARAISGSVVLDIIPEALGALKSRPKYKQMYLQDNMGTEFILPQGVLLEEAVEIWQAAIHSNRRKKSEADKEENKGLPQNGE